MRFDCRFSMWLRRLVPILMVAAWAAPTPFARAQGFQREVAPNETYYVTVIWIDEHGKEQISGPLPFRYDPILEEEAPKPDAWPHEGNLRAWLDTEQARQDCARWVKKQGGTVVDLSLSFAGNRATPGNNPYGQGDIIVREPLDKPQPPTSAPTVTQPRVTPGRPPALGSLPKQLPPSFYAMPPGKESGSTRVKRYPIQRPAAPVVAPKPAVPRLENEPYRKPRDTFDSMPRLKGVPDASPFSAGPSQKKLLVQLDTDRPKSGAVPRAPGGVSMRLGIDRNTYDRAQAPESLLSKIRGAK